MVIWYVGLSRAGKTTLSRQLYDKLKPSIPNLVLLDGDAFRGIFQNDTDYSVAGRFENARRLSHLTKLLSDQGIHVIAAVLSIFPEWQRWNRENIEGYCQIYVRASMDALLTRDTNRLYEGAREGRIDNVVGVDIPFPEPVDSDLIIENSTSRDDFADFLEEVLKLPLLRRL